MRMMHQVAATGVSMSRPDRDTAFTDYMAARQQALTRTAYLLCGSWTAADDIVQVALAKLYLRWDRVATRGQPDAYVRRVIINENTSLWRRAWRRREQSTAELPERGRQDEYDDGTADAVWALVQTLPRRQRAVVVLRYYEELSESEIADALGIAPGTVKSQASRALASLRNRLPAELREEE